MQGTREFYKTLIFAIEQWLALLIGITCLALSLWALVEGHKAFSSHHVSHLDSSVLVATGWSLTVIVGLLGCTLMRFAFSASSGGTSPERSTQQEAKTNGSDPGGSTRRSKLVAPSAGRG